LSWKFLDGNFKIFVSSAGKGYDNSDDHEHAIIKINGTDYSQNKRGFNFVVVDGKNGKLVHSHF
jgi:hypothetical protein